MFSVFVKEKVTVHENLTFTNYASGMLPDYSKLAINQKNDNEVTTCGNDVTVNVFDVAFFLLSSLVTGPSSMPISSPVLEL